MRPFHEVMRLVGLEEGADIPEPQRVDPLALAHLGETLYRVGRTGSEVEAGLELFCREENVKPAVLMAAVREARVMVDGQPGIHTYRALLFSGRMERDGMHFQAHASGLDPMEAAKRRHPSHLERRVIGS